MIWNVVRRAEGWTRGATGSVGSVKCCSINTWNQIICWASLPGFDFVICPSTSVSTLPPPFISFFFPPLSLFFLFDWSIWRGVLDTASSLTWHRENASAYCRQSNYLPRRRRSQTERLKNKRLLIWWSPALGNLLPCFDWLLLASSASKEKTLTFFNDFFFHPIGTAHLLVASLKWKTLNWHWLFFLSDVIYVAYVPSGVYSWKGIGRFPSLHLGRLSVQHALYSFIRGRSASKWTWGLESISKPNTADVLMKQMDRGETCQTLASPSQPLIGTIDRAAGESKNEIVSRVPLT